MVQKAIIVVILMLVLPTLVNAGEVVLVEKRQSAGMSDPLEQTHSVKLSDGRVAKLVTCCGIDQDDSALYTMRDADGYTLVDQRFTGGKYFLTPQAQLIAIHKTGPAFTVTFHDALLKIVNTINLAGVYSLANGENGSIAVLIQRPEGAVLRVYDDGGQMQWEKQNMPVGSLAFLPGESHVALNSGNKLLLLTPGETAAKELVFTGQVAFVGADPRSNTFFLTTSEPAGGEIVALAHDTFAERWRHRVAETPVGGCTGYAVDVAQYLSGPELVVLLLKCRGARHFFYVVRFLDRDGKVVGQERLGRRVTPRFYEIQNTVAIISDDFIYSFAVRN